MGRSLPSTNSVVFLALANVTDIAQDMHSEQKLERYQFGLKMVWLLLPCWHTSSGWKARYTPQHHAVGHHILNTWQQGLIVYGQGVSPHEVDLNQYQRLSSFSYQGMRIQMTLTAENC